MSVRKSLILFIVFTLIFVIVKIPAALVVNLLPLPKGAAYQGLEGTLWQGSVRQIQVNRQLISDVKWQFQPLRLFTGAVAYQVSFGKPRISQTISGSGLVSIGITGKKIKDATFRMAAAEVKPFLPIPIGHLAGRVIANIKEYELGQPICQVANGEISWNKAGVDIGGSIEFGSIDANLSCEEGKLLAQFDGQNSLGLTGQARIESSSKFGFDGFVKPSADLPAVVHQGISAVAKMDAQGRYKINL